MNRKEAEAILKKHIGEIDWPLFTGSRIDGKIIAAMLEISEISGKATKESSTAGERVEEKSTEEDKEVRCVICKQVLPDEDYHRWGICLDCYTET